MFPEKWLHTFAPLSCLPSCLLKRGWTNGCDRPEVLRLPDHWTDEIEVLIAVKRALISDIHSNLEGLEAVLQDIRQQKITEIYCLGDIIGYGPNPRECIDLIIDCDAYGPRTTIESPCFPRSSFLSRMALHGQGCRMGL